MDKVMHWSNYLACFFAGVFFIHIIPHITGRLNVTNILLVLVNLILGLFFLWAGKFSLRKKWTIFFVLLGAVSVMIFASVRESVHRRAMEHPTLGTTYP